MIDHAIDMLYQLILNPLYLLILCLSQTTKKRLETKLLEGKECENPKEKAYFVLRRIVWLNKNGVVITLKTYSGSSFIRPIKGVFSLLRSFDDRPCN
jgi:hypothetical protein